MSVLSTRLRILIGLTLGVLALGLVWSIPPARAISRDQLNHGILSTVKLGVWNAESEIFALCSGTVIHPSGLILTNWHCVGRTNDSDEDDSGQNLSRGQLYHPNGLVAVGPTKDSKSAPLPTYVAQAVAGTPELDVAVLKIVSMFDPKEKLPASLPLVVMSAADSDAVQIGDPVHVLGYPGIGGDLVTYTTGIVSGFDDRNKDGALDSIKTNAVMAPGVSGGLVMNDAGQQVGIPTWGLTEGAAKIDRMMANGIATPYIASALAGATLPSNGGATSQPSRPAPAGGTRPATTNGVTVRAQIVDADTRRPIANASFGALKSGVTWAQFVASDYSDALMAAAAVTDQQGQFQTAPPLDRGKSYVVFAGAKGYQARYWDPGLDLPTNAESIFEGETIVLKKS